jgi:hypothetical protein
VAEVTESEVLAEAKPSKPLWQRAERFHQIGFVVADLEDGLDEFSAALGVARDRWRVFDTGKPFEHHEGDRQIAAFARYARLQSGPTAYQLLQPMTSGTIWQRWLEDGIRQFAVGYFVPDLGAAESELGCFGAKRLAWGQISEDDAAFGYSFFRLPRTGIVIELISARDSGIVPAPEVSAKR